MGSCLALKHLGLKGCSALVSPSIHSAKLESLDLSLCEKLVREGVAKDTKTHTRIIHIQQRVRIKNPGRYHLEQSQSFTCWNRRKAEMERL